LRSHITPSEPSTGITFLVCYVVFMEVMVLYLRYVVHWQPYNAWSTAPVL
jgi:hypothetical protein